MTDSIADDIRAAIAETNGSEEEAPKAAENISVEVDPANEEAVELPKEKADGEEKTRERGPDGKFVAKSDEKTDDATEQQPKTETVESIRPPASWSAQAKAKFATLDPEVQREVLRREKEVDAGFRKRADELKRYEPLESVIAPYRSKWAASGVDEATAVKQLLAASDWLEKDPNQAIAYLARQYGVNFTGQPQAQPAMPGPAHQGQPNPEMEALKQELSSLKQSMQEREQSTLQSQIEAFANDPANLYFENVRGDMAVLIDSGKAKDLAEAYEMACWMRPDIRPLLQTPQVKADPAKDREKAAKAKAAGSSVTGSPSAAGAPSKSNGTIEDDIRLAIQQVTSRA